MLLGMNIVRRAHINLPEGKISFVENGTGNYEIPEEMDRLKMSILSENVCFHTGRF